MREYNFRHIAHHDALQLSFLDADSEGFCLTSLPSCIQWQQNLGSGEFDSAVCDNGISRWSNYYLEGLRHMTENPPHTRGICTRLPLQLRHQCAFML